MSKNPVPICEPAVIPDTFASSLGPVQLVGPDLFRVYVLSRQKALYGDGSPEDVVVARLILTADTLKAMAAAMLQVGTTAPEPTHAPAQPALN